MTRFFTLLTLIAATIFASCNKTETDENSANYQYVYNGILLYGCALPSNSIAMDGVSVAMSLAIMLSEADAVGLEMKDGSTDVLVDGDDKEWEWNDLSKLSSSSISSSKREFLFGGELYTTITRSDNKYTIEYNDSNGKCDNHSRTGKYIIDTNGVALVDSDSDNKWTVSNSGNMLLDSGAIIIGSQGYVSYEALCTLSESTLYCSGDGEFSFEMNVEFNSVDDEDGDTIYGSWGHKDAPGTITFSSYTKGGDNEGEALALSDILDNDIEYTTYAGGVSLGGDSLDISTVEPVAYNFAVATGWPIGGGYKVAVEASDSYSAANVEVSFSCEISSYYGYLFSDTYLYNGYTYVDSYYMYY